MLQLKELKILSPNRRHRWLRFIDSLSTCISESQLVFWQSWGNVCWGIFLVTWSPVFLLSVEHLVFVSVNISASWVNWRSLVASLSTSRWLSWVLFDVLMAWDNSWWRQVYISSFALVVVSLRWDLGATFHRWLNSEISLALKSWLWDFAKVFLA